VGLEAFLKLTPQGERPRAPGQGPDPASAGHSPPRSLPLRPVMPRNTDEDGYATSRVLDASPAATPDADRAVRQTRGSDPSVGPAREAHWARRAHGNGGRSPVFHPPAEATAFLPRRAIQPRLADACGANKGERQSTLRGERWGEAHFGRVHPRRDTRLHLGSDETVNNPRYPQARREATLARSSTGLSVRRRTPVPVGALLEVSTGRSL
jgi:hypothetical protein